jgi:hypothetical protein
MERLAERGWEFFMGFAPGNVFLAGLLKLISKGAETLSVDIGESVRACAGKTRSWD